MPTSVSSRSSPVTHPSTPPPPCTSSASDNWKEHKFTLIGAGSVAMIAAISSLSGGLLTNPMAWTVTAALISLASIAYFFFQLFAERPVEAHLSRDVTPITSPSIRSRTSSTETVTGSQNSSPTASPIDSPNGSPNTARASLSRSTSGQEPPIATPIPRARAGSFASGSWNPPEMERQPFRERPTSANNSFPLDPGLSDASRSATPAVQSQPVRKLSARQQLASSWNSLVAKMPIAKVENCFRGCVRFVKETPINPVGASIAITGVITALSYRYIHAYNETNTTP